MEVEAERCGRKAPLLDKVTHGAAGGECYGHTLFGAGQGVGIGEVGVVRFDPPDARVSGIGRCGIEFLGAALAGQAGRSGVL
jgi:hypothetical protein